MNQAIIKDARGLLGKDADNVSNAALWAAFGMVQEEADIMRPLGKEHQIGQFGKDPKFVEKMRELILTAKK